MSTIGRLFRTHLEDYAPKFSEYFDLTRRDGILQVRMHTGGSDVLWGLEVHRLLIPLFQHIDHDEDNEVVIITGTGATFNAETDLDSFARYGIFEPWSKEVSGYDVTYRDQLREINALLSLDVPVISAINGPVLYHFELTLTNDIVICSEDAHFRDGHWQSMGIVPGDGVQTIMRQLIGENRAKHFLYMGTTIDAAEALSLGMVGEVLPPSDVLPRAWEIAEKCFMTKSRVQRRLARSLLVQPWRELFARETALGMAHECLATAISGLHLGEK
jgi:enoyl-CoA hydratase/carnithine racemase